MRRMVRFEEELLSVSMWVHDSEIVAAVCGSQTRLLQAAAAVVAAVAEGLLAQTHAQVSGRELETRLHASTHSAALTRHYRSNQRCALRVLAGQTYRAGMTGTREAGTGLGRESAASATTSISLIRPTKHQKAEIDAETPPRALLYESD